MFGYYLELAIRNFRRNVMLTSLMVFAVGVGIGTSMTVLTVLRAMSSDPIPDKSSQLFRPQIDTWGPASRRGSLQTTDPLEDQFAYRDVMALLQAHRGAHQAAMYSVLLDIVPAGGKAFLTNGRAASADFFAMFDVPFSSGGPWSVADDDKRAGVVVLTGKLAARLFPQGGAVGKTVEISAHPYRVVGVLAPWNPQPRFYDTNGAFGAPDQFFLPFSTAIDRQMGWYGSGSCNGPNEPGWLGHLNSECIWLQFWVELPTAHAEQAYRQFLYNYAAQQRQAGRFHWAPRVELHNVREWLALEHVVPDEQRITTVIAFGFLVVCLINGVGLLLAKFLGRAGDIGIRRALGASRADIFMQCTTETVLIGTLGGILGLGLTVLGLMGQRALLGPSVERLARLDSGMILITLAVAVAAAISSGLYPTWRASRLQVGWQLKTQ